MAERTAPQQPTKDTVITLYGQVRPGGALVPLGFCEGNSPEELRVDFSELLRQLGEHVQNRLNFQTIARRMGDDL